jgi:hypothetical protein
MSLRSCTTFLVVITSIAAVLGFAGAASAHPAKAQRPIDLQPCHYHGHTQWRAHCASHSSRGPIHLKGSQAGLSMGRSLVVRKIPMRGWPHCRSARAYRFIYSAAHVTLAKIYNTTAWCYGRRGKILSISGLQPPDHHTWFLWDSSGVKWSKHYLVRVLEPNLAYTNATGKFFLNIGGYHVQTWTPNVCFEIDGSGRAKWCDAGIV